jgi:hypothetical protein
LESWNHELIKELNDIGGDADGWFEERTKDSHKQRVVLPPAMQKYIGKYGEGFDKQDSMPVRS